MGQIDKTTTETNDALNQHLDDLSLVFPCTPNIGIKCGDETTNAFGWKDLVGQIIPRAGGGAAPAFTAFRGTKVKEYAFSASDVIDNITFHIPHDYVEGSDMYIHIHWGHNGTAISGTLSGNYYVMYSKGYNQAGEIFNQELTIPFTTTITDINSHPQWGHNILEQVFTNDGGDSTHLDRNKIQTDGLIVVAFDISSIPSITGSSESNLPYIFMIDLHYQSTEIATKNRNYPFHT